MMFFDVWVMMKIVASNSTGRFFRIGVIMVFAIWIQISDSQSNGAGYFVPLNLDGYKIRSPLNSVQVQTVKQCILVCLDTTGCTAVAMFNSTCQPFDGQVYEVHEHLYSQAYENKDLAISCLSELSLGENVEILKIYPRHHGFVTLTCSHGYIGSETSLTTGSTCDWTGLQPICLKMYQWEDNSYVFITGDHNWTESYSSCKSLGGRLTDIQSADENTFILATINQNSYTDSFWIGGYRLNTYTFLWIDINQTLSYKNWNPGDPNNALESENCVSLYRPTKFSMVDQACEVKNGYICKISTTQIY